MTSAKGRGFAVEDFVQAFTAQLDRAQDALALKARVGRPLTFALKDLSLDLKVFFETDEGGRLLMRHAGPNETGFTSIQLNFTSITRSMVEENTLAMNSDDDPRSLDDLRGQDGLDDQERRKLEWAGVRTVGQFKKLTASSDPKQMEAYIGIPVLRLRAALERSSRPVVTGNELIHRGDGDHWLRVRGANLTNGATPQVKLSGEPVEVLEATPNSIVVRPQEHHREGMVEVQVGPGQSANGFYRIPQPAKNAGRTAESKPASSAPTVEPLETSNFGKQDFISQPMMSAMPGGDQ